MWNRLKKDIRKRKEFKESELERLSWIVIKNNKILPIKNRQEVVFKNKLTKKGSISVIKNRCILSGRGRGILKEWGLSRIKFRELADQGLISGVKRSKW